MRLLNLVPKSPRGVFGALVLVPMLYAGFALTSTPAQAAGVSDKLICIAPELESSQSGDCFSENGSLDPQFICCHVCYNYRCANGGGFSRCTIECGAQC